MALQGKVVFKGLDINEAYVVISSARCSVNNSSASVLKTAATYNEDGSLKAEAVYETQFTKKLNGSYTASVYLNAAAKVANPNAWITEIYGSYAPDHKSSAKNDVAQAYGALKLVDAYKDLADA